MPKTLKLAFTGNAVLTPEYPDDLQPIAGPLYAVMPGARRVRQSDFHKNQINAQFAFVTFPYRHLVVKDETDRDADHKHPDTRDTKIGLCFLQREHLDIYPPPLNGELTFDDSSTADFPTTATTGVKRAARWSDFASDGEPELYDVLNSEGDYARIRIPAGHVSSGFVTEPIALIGFDYGNFPPPPTAYAQEIVVTLTYPDDTPSVFLYASPFAGEATEPSTLRFDFYDASEIKILFGNGSLASMISVLNGSFAGNDHEGDYDVEFEVLYDVVDCPEDQNNLLPLPQILSNEILHVPCVASMVALPGSTARSKASARSSANAAPRVVSRRPGAPRSQSPTAPASPTAQRTPTVTEIRREPGQPRAPRRKP
jgi:hypothetical protein